MATKEPFKWICSNLFNCRQWLKPLSYSYLIFFIPEKIKLAAPFTYICTLIHFFFFFFRVNSWEWTVESHHKLWSRNPCSFGITLECKYLRIKVYVAYFWCHPDGNSDHLCSEARSLEATLVINGHLVSLQSGINPHCLWNCVIHLSVWSSSPYPHGLPPSVCKSFFQVSFCFFQCTPITFSTHVLFFLHIQILGVCFFFFFGNVH